MAIVEVVAELRKLAKEFKGSTIDSSRRQQLLNNLATELEDYTKEIIRVIQGEEHR